MRLIIVTDLDGTLLDHHTYSFQAAKPALDTLKRVGIPLVLATSKTAAEVREIHTSLDLGPTPAIVENGAGYFYPDHADTDGVTAYQRIRAALSALPTELRERFRGFGDMDDSEVAEITGLSCEAAQRARNRSHSEPCLWAGTPQTLDRFKAELSKHGMEARFGGRFLTLSFGRTKADAMRELTETLSAEKTVALGDAPNDTEMLEAADWGFIIRNDTGTTLPPLAGETDGRIRRTAQEGPAGWNDAVLQILEELNLV